MFLKKVASSSRNSNKCSRTLPQDNCYNSVSSRKALCIFSTSSYSIQSSFMSDSLRPHGLSTPGCAHSAHLSITNSRSLLKLVSIVSVMPSNHLILCCPLLLPPSIFPSIRVFSMNQLFPPGGPSIGVSASTSVFPMNTQVISFSMDWLDLLAVQGTLKSLLQHHSSKASILWGSAFLIVQLSHHT